MSTGPLEALLRPPVEMYSSIVAASAASFMLIAPERLMMVPTVAYGGAAVIGGLALSRLRDAHRIRKYQRGLRKLPYWSLAPDQIPVSDRYLFLGNGFRWTGTHTQRLYDAMLPDNLKYSEPSRLYQRARDFEVKHERNPMAKGLIKALQAQRWAMLPNPVAPLPDIGGTPAIHGVGLLEGEAPVHQALGERVAHTIVIGTTRVGKTRMAEVLINQDIRRGDCVIVIDPKGDAELLRSCYVAAVLAGRAKDFHMMHLGFPEHSVRYNPIGDYARITEVATRVARQLPGEGQSSTFREFVWGYINGIAKAMDYLGMRPTYKSLETYGINIDPLVAQYAEAVIVDAQEKKLISLPPDWRDQLKEFAHARTEDGKAFLMKVDRPQQERNRYTVALAKVAMGDSGIYIFRGLKNLIPGSPGEALFGLFAYDPGHYSKLTASLFPFLAKLTTGKVAEILAPDYADASDTRPVLDWLSFIRQNGIIYIGLDALSDPDVAAVVGSTMFSDLVSTLGRVYKHGYHEGLPDNGTPIQRFIRLHADEFSDLIREDFIPLLNKGGGAGSVDKGGFSATVYTQTLSDIVARLGDVNKAGQTLGNLNTVVMLRVKEPKTAEYLTEQLPKVTVKTTMLVSGSQDNPDGDSDVTFRSGQELRITSTEVPMVSVDSLINLPKGQAFVLKDGGSLHKIRLPLATNAKVDIPSSIEGMAKAMADNYRSEGADEWARHTPVWEKVFRDATAAQTLLDANTVMPSQSPGDWYAPEHGQAGEQDAAGGDDPDGAPLAGLDIYGQNDDHGGGA